LKNKTLYYLNAVINSYAILFFSQNKVFGLLLLAVSFINPVAGLSGLAGVIIAVAIANFSGYQQKDIETGIFSFNALLFGVGFGTFYHVNHAFFTWLLVGYLVSVLFTLALCRLFAKHNLPILSLPFTLSFWVILAAASSIFQMGLVQRNSSLLYELTANSNARQLPFYIDLFFRSLSAMLFQNNALSGLIIAVGLFIHSRIAFTVAVIGFITACLFNHFTGVFPDGLSYYHLGANLIIASIATGSFFLVPSFRSYLLAIAVVPLVTLFIVALTKVTMVHDLPVLSLPFCLLTLLLLYFLKSVKISGKALLTPLQFYSPEHNLYQYLNNQKRLKDYQYFNLKLPFMGNWKVSQGYNGAITHNSDWAQALDFVIEDDNGLTYKNTGALPEDYYCYGKPVMACGDGTIVSVIDTIEDNEIGDINLKDNWGNTIIIEHKEGLYSKVSHLKKASAKVKAGDEVKQGDIMALCGTSGRSPEPHLHFQVQETPYLGSKTLSYPFSGFFTFKNGEKTLRTFAIPDEDETVSRVAINKLLKDAFDFKPGTTFSIASSDGYKETVEVDVDAWNETYLYSKEKDAYAYFVNNSITFYFTTWYGSKDSLLYLFYQAAYKVVFADQAGHTVVDEFSLQHLPKTPLTWLNDLFSPFFQFIDYRYISETSTSANEIVISSMQSRSVSGKAGDISNTKIYLRQGGIAYFSFNRGKTNTEVEWHTRNIY
jgi:urea transporter/murein DD-endopeptidase MepM/ murein hydrolase activator NlpD